MVGRSLPFHKFLWATALRGMHESTFFKKNQYVKFLPVLQHKSVQKTCRKKGKPKNRNRRLPVHYSYPPANVTLKNVNIVLTTFYNSLNFFLKMKICLKSTRTYFQNMKFIE